MIGADDEGDSFLFPAPRALAALTGGQFVRVLLLRDEEDDDDEEDAGAFDAAVEVVVAVLIAFFVGILDFWPCEAFFVVASASDPFPGFDAPAAGVLLLFLTGVLMALFLPESLVFLLKEADADFVFLADDALVDSAMGASMIRGLSSSSSTSIPSSLFCVIISGVSLFCCFESDCLLTPAAGCC